MKLPSIVIALALVLSSISCNKETKVTEARKDSGPTKVTAATARDRVVKRTVESVGTLFPYDETIVSAEIDGRVDKVEVDLGDVVKKGQLMVHISDEEQRYLLAQNEAQLRSSLERLGLTRDTDRVQDIKQTPDVRKAQADVFDAEQRFKRTRELRDQGIGAQAELDQAQARFNSATAAYDSTINQTRNLIQEVERFKAVVDLQRKKLRDTNVYAPFEASLKERQVTVGQYVRANTPLMTLVKTTPLRLRLDVPERMAPWVKEGQVAVVEVEAFEGQKFPGKIWRVSPTVDSAKRTFIAEALIDNPGMRLKPGSYAKARIPTDKTETIVLLPNKAVQYVLGSNKAYVIKDGTIEAREVKIGERFENDLEILEGVATGETVATSNLPRIDTGSRVEIEGSPTTISQKTK
ncbi:efflux RND transporter periplasmic adaptor subunit [Bryobacter aggregatus]|uniref:efflux RND transporter periplasmic adaptor subunit n=1 Tax=Bryobacter aggregatus TaxID=360054 RepID=UPI0004E0AFAF|nr:efflux RND transporter periplasmic adaptor subunit [Bryobacter aggregatus]